MEDKFLNDLSKKINKLIDKEFEKEGFDRTYFEFKLICNILNESLDKTKEIELINDENKGYCMFCRKLSYYYNKDLDGYICVECFKKLQK